VAQLLSERGATIIDADVLSRRAVESGTEAHRAIAERWGTSILSADGTLDRGALRRIVFGDPAELEQLNSIVHPEVERMRAELVERARQRGDRLVVCDIPLLFERRMTERFDRIVLVDAPRPVRLERLVRERGLRATSQRVVMHRLLRERDRHVSAEELLAEAGERLPGVSLPTVYATLELFEQLGVVRRVNGGGGTLLWDTRTDSNHPAPYTPLTLPTIDSA